MLLKEHPQRLFGDYTIKRKLGVGGMATVYHAVHNDLQRDVAIKIIHEHFVDDDVAVKRLLREAQIAKKLKHPNIVPIITFNHVNRRPYLVMPFYEGKTLADYFVQPREITHDISLNILTKLADALDYAHSQGVIHRDFKLENILLSKNNDPAISDFGIAQIANTTRLTATGNFLGTPQYMAPEQASSAYDEVDYRVDLYAFGVMAYLMLTGVFPFTAPDPIQLVIKHTTQPVPSPTLINNNLPKAVDAVLIRALAKTPDYRYASATEFVQSLSGALNNISPVTTMIDMKKLNPAELSQSLDASLRKSALASMNPATRKLDMTDLISDDAMPAESIPAVQTNDDERPTRKKRAPFLFLLLFTVMLMLTTLWAVVEFGSGQGLNTLIIQDNVAETATLELTSIEESAENTVIEDGTPDSNTIRNNALFADNVQRLVIGLTATAEATQTVTATGTITATDASNSANSVNMTATLLVSTTATTTLTPSPSITPSMTSTIRPTNTVRPTNTFIPPTNTPRPQPTQPPAPVQPTNVPQQPEQPPANQPEQPSEPSNPPAQQPSQPSNPPAQQPSNQSASSQVVQPETPSNSQGNGNQ